MKVNASSRHSRRVGVGRLGTCFTPVEPAGGSGRRRCARRSVGSTVVPTSHKAAQGGELSRALKDESRRGAVPAEPPPSPLRDAGRALPVSSSDGPRIEAGSESRAGVSERGLSHATPRTQEQSKTAAAELSRRAGRGSWRFALCSLLLAWRRCSSLSRPSADSNGFSEEPECAGSWRVGWRIQASLGVVA